MPRHLSAAIALALAFPALANTAPDADDEVFTLGQLTVTGKRPEPLATGDSTIKRLGDRRPRRDGRGDQSGHPQTHQTV